MKETQEKADAAQLPQEVRQPLQVALISLAQAAHSMPPDHAGLVVVMDAMFALAQVMGLDSGDGEAGEVS